MCCVMYLPSKYTNRFVNNFEVIRTVYTFESWNDRSFFFFFFYCAQNALSVYILWSSVMRSVNWTFNIIQCSRFTQSPISKWCTKFKHFELERSSANLLILLNFQRYSEFITFCVRRLVFFFPKLRDFFSKFYENKFSYLFTDKIIGT